MKKFILGIVVGALFATAGSAFAASGLIGKKVDSEAKVILNGESMSNGIVIEGKSYAPVRDITESLGLEVSYFKDSGKMAVIEIVKSDSEVAKEQTLQNLEVKKAKAQEEIKLLTQAIENLEADNIKQKADMDTFTQDWVKVPIQHSIDTNNAGIEENKKRIAELQTEIAAIDAEIAKLEGA